METWTVQEGASRWELPLAEHPALEIESDFVELAIVQLVDGESPFLELVGGGGAPHVEVRGDGGTTRVSVGRWNHGGHKWKGRWWDAASWGDKRHGKFRAQLVAHVPPYVRARVRSAAARIRVEGLRGCDLGIQTDAGTMALRDVTGRVRLATDAGRIDAEGIGGALDIATGAGAVHLDITSLDAGKHRVRTNMGATRIALPQGLPVRIDARTAMGSSRVEFPSTRDAAAVLDVEADLGAIRVFASDRTWRGADSAPAAEPTPYRSPPEDDVNMRKILERVANGSLSPADARELLRAMGWG